MYYVLITNLIGRSWELNRVQTMQPNDIQHTINCLCHLRRATSFADQIFYLLRFDKHYFAVDEPNPQISLEYEPALGTKKFSTQPVIDDVNPEWNETFTFVLPDDHEDNDAFRDSELKVIDDSEGNSKDPVIGSQQVCPGN